MNCFVILCARQFSHWSPAVSGAVSLNPNVADLMASIAGCPGVGESGDKPDLQYKLKEQDKDWRGTDKTYIDCFST